jgi:lantibiotic modifying enzyme
MNIIDATIHTETTRHNVRLMIPILVHWAKIGKTDGTYGNISDILGKGGSQWVGEALLKVQEVINTLSEQSGRNIPTLNALVKNRATHISHLFDDFRECYEDIKSKKSFIYIRKKLANIEGVIRILKDNRYFNHLPNEASVDKNL